MTPQTGPDSPLVFVIIAVILALVVIVERHHEARRRLYRAKLPNVPRCEVIGCEPRPSTRYLPHHGIYACDRCANELLELRREFGGAA